LERGLPNTNDLLAEHTNAIELLGIKQSMLEDATEGVIPTYDQLNQQYQNLAQTIIEYRSHQDDLHTSAEAERVMMVQLASASYRK
jgi:hypothetical protein